jgi:hypothetical protein
MGRQLVIDGHHHCDSGLAVGSHVFSFFLGLHTPITLGEVGQTVAIVPGRRRAARSYLDSNFGLVGAAYFRVSMF